MSTTPNVPETQEAFHPQGAGGTPRWILIVFVIVFVIVGYLLYAGHSGRTQLENELAQTNGRAKALAVQVEQTNTRLTELRGQLDLTSQKLGLTQEELARARSLALAARKEGKETGEKLSAQLGQVKQEAESKIGQVSTELGGAKTDIEATKKDLEATKSKLERTVGDMGVMSGLVAHNKEELEELKRRGERNIFEFDVRKSKTPQRVGPVQLTLNKVDAKRYKFTMTVIADDKAIEKKDKTVNEPVQFYVKAVRTPYEIVVFEVGKDRATGYLTTPK